MNTINTLALAGVAMIAMVGGCRPGRPVIGPANYHVAPSGNDGNEGSPDRPLKTIAAAANRAMPGDTITVHAGIYRERVDPPRGGESDARRITYAAAAGETVVISGSEPAKGWQQVSGDVWKLCMSGKSFGNFNPYIDRIRGDWFDPRGRVHHTGCVYVDGEWLVEARDLAGVMDPAATSPAWFATVDGDSGRILANLAWFRVGGGDKLAGGEPSFRYGGKPSPCTDGGTCSGHHSHGCWLRYDAVDFGAGAREMEIRAAASASAGDTLIEIRRDDPEGELLGTCMVAPTGDWQAWQSFRVGIKPTRGRQTLCMVFKAPEVDTGTTTIHARFPRGVDPNVADVEINRRQTVFYPSRNGINFITVRGFIMENAATNWAPPSSEQRGVIGTNWSKGWIIEHNTVRHSKCAGIALGKYGDGTDNTNDAGAADPYTACIKRALARGWGKASVGSHVVRGNHIHHCEQAGIVGSMGAVFSTITGNEIHDIHMLRLFAGAEMGGIKIHGAVDTEISGNHIYRVGGVAGIWLDWMAQGTLVTGNLLHDNSSHDIFVEVNHGPFVIANNICLSGQSIRNWSNGGAYAHNMFAGGFEIRPEPGRRTPYLVPHGVEIAGMKATELGDDRYFNNIVRGGKLSVYDNAPLPVKMDGNVFVAGGKPCAQEQNPQVQADFDPAPVLSRGPDGCWYLEITMEPGWSHGPRRPLVGPALLGKACLPDQAYAWPDGTPVILSTDYFGRSRDPANPFPGPVEVPGGGKIKLMVWPRPGAPETRPAA